MQLFQAKLDEAIGHLSSMSDGDFDKNWTVRRGEQVMFNIPKKVAVRGLGFQSPGTSPGPALCIPSFAWCAGTRNVRPQR
ncbi:MAG: hypothetical protein WDO19_18765 [Bacteroidota bacterium]